MRFSLILLALLLAVGMIVGQVSASYSVIVATNNSFDGRIYRAATNESLSSIIAGGGSGVSNPGTDTSTTLRADSGTDKYNYSQFIALVFNTGDALPDNADIKSAAVGLRYSSSSTTLGNSDINVIKFNADGALSTDDYDNVEHYNFSTGKPISTLSSGRYWWNFTSLGLSNISKTGDTGVAVASDYFIVKSAPWVDGATTSATFLTSEYNSGQYPPQVEIVYDLFPIAAFSGTPTSGTAPLTVTFTDASTNTTGASWSWSYSNKSGEWHIFNTSQNPVQTFTYPDVYDINLTMTNPSGTSTETKTDYIDVRPSGHYTVKILGTTVQGEYPNGTIIASGTAGTDDGSVIVGVITNASAGSTVAFNGNFVPDGSINISKSLDLKGYGNASFLWNTGSAFNNGLFYCLGSASVAVYNLTADANPGDTVIHVESTTGVLTTDNFQIYDNLIYNPIAYTTWKSGESHTITSIDSVAKTITISEPIITGYKVTNNAKYYAPHPISVNFDGIYIYSTDAATNSHYGISFNYVQNSSVTNSRIDSIGSAGIAIYNSANFTVNGDTISRCNKAGLGYGVVIADFSSFITISHSNISDCRHTIATGGTSNAGQPKNITVDSNNLIGWDTDDAQALDSHPIVISMDVINNTISQPYASVYAYGAQLGAKNVRLTNNIFITNGTGFRDNPRMANCTLIATGNTFKTQTIGLYLQRYGVGDYGITTNTTYDYVYFHDNTLSGSGELLRVEYPSIALYLDTDALAPKASFSAVQTIPLVGKKSVTFTDNTTAYSALNVAGVPTSWLWDARNVTGNNTIVNVSTSQNPTIVFGPGNYSITLTASNAAGSNTTTTAYWVNVSASDSSSVPIVDFSANATTVCYGAAVAFTDSSTNVSSWSWAFGDGATSTEQNPTHVYNISSGYFTVALTGSNGIGTDTETKSNYINVQGSCGGGSTVPTAHPFSAATGSSMIVTAMGIIGLAIIGFGVAIVVGALSSQSTDGLVAGIFTIMLGGAILIISYMFLSPIMNLVA